MMNLGGSESRLKGVNIRHQWERIKRIGREDPVWWIESVLGVRLYQKQRDVAYAVAREGKVSVRSGHGVGKDFVSACLSFWWVFVQEDDRGMVLVTAPKWAQIQDIFFNTLKQVAYGPVKVPLVGMWEKGNDIQKSQWQLGPFHGIYGLNASEPVRVQGYHSPNTLVIVDEASGVSDEMMTALKGALAYAKDGHAKMLLIGNPTENTGHFADTFKEGSGWKNIHISCYDSPNITGEMEIPGLADRQYIEDMKREYGENSSTFRVHVLGEFSIEGAVDRVIAENVLEKAVGFVPKRLLLPDGYEIRSCVQGFDVARFGDNRTVSAIVKDGVLIDAEGVQGYSTIQAAAWAMERAKAFGCQLTVVDETGLGAGVFDQLKAQGVSVLGVDFSGRIASTRYFNKRTEMAFTMSDALRDGKFGIERGLHKLVMEDLRETRYLVNAEGRLQLEDKHACKRRIGRSPDFADAVFLAWYGYDKARESTPAELAQASLNRFFIRRRGIAALDAVGYGGF